MGNELSYGSHSVYLEVIPVFPDRDRKKLSIQDIWRPTLRGGSTAHIFIPERPTGHFSINILLNSHMAHQARPRTCTSVRFTLLHTVVTLWLHLCRQTCSSNRERHQRREIKTRFSVKRGIIILPNGHVRLLQTYATYANISLPVP